jgi:type II secretory pathway pseudopilin PulG
MAQGLVMIRRQGGFSYVIVMFLVAVLSIVTVRAMENTLTMEKREKEAEALWRGMAYREAIRVYYESSPGTEKSYPQELKDLLYDARLVRPTRPLRRLYTDPLSGGEWGVVRNDAGRIIGVYPNSNAAPLKQAGFPDILATFTAAMHYSDWKFIYQPR